MILDNATDMVVNTTTSMVSQMSFPDFIATVKPLTIFVIGVLIYVIFIFKFYRSIAKKDIVKLDLEKYVDVPGDPHRKTKMILLNFLENFILTPIAVLAWVGIVAFIMLFLAENYTADMLLITSVATVAVIRAATYYNEDLSIELAKVLPFTLLAILIFDASQFSIENSLLVATQLPVLWKNIMYYLLFAMGLEIIMRITRTMVKLVKQK